MSMKKNVLLIIMIIGLTLWLGCSSDDKNSVDLIELDIAYSDVTEISIRTANNSTKVEKNEEWEKILEVVINFDYESISKEEVIEIVEDEDSFFQVSFVDRDSENEFIIYKDKIIFVSYKDGINEDEIEPLIVEHSDVAILYSELLEFDFPTGSVLCKKPIIYLYPQIECDISIRLDPKVNIVSSYPKYNDGWQVRSNEYGEIVDSKNKKYLYLFWEGEIEHTFSISEGFVVSKEETSDFLEEKLEILGFNYKEMNDFITYWLPELEKSKYNKIQFLTQEYEELVPMYIAPKPETLIRVFMVFEGLDQLEKIEPQELEKKRRVGYTVFEWGGAEIE